MSGGHALSGPLSHLSRRREPARSPVPPTTASPRSLLSITQHQHLSRPPLPPRVARRLARLNASERDIARQSGGKGTAVNIKRGRHSTLPVPESQLAPPPQPPFQPRRQRAPVLLGDVRGLENAFDDACCIGAKVLGTCRLHLREGCQSPGGTRRV